MGKQETQSSSGQTLSVIERSSEILECVMELDGANLTEIATAVDLPTSTTYTYLQSLNTVGLLTKSGKKYDISFRLLEYGGKIRNQNELFRVSRDRVDELAQETGELANLGIEKDGKRVLLYKSEGEDAVYDDAPTGEYTHMHWSALGKAMLAFLPEQRAQDIIDKYGLPRGTNRTIESRDRLFETLEDVRDQGYAVENGQRVEGIQAVAMPIQPDDNLLGAIAVAGPKSRLTEQRITDELLEQIQEKVNIIELKYTYY